MQMQFRSISKDEAKAVQVEARGGGLCSGQGGGRLAETNTEPVGTL